VSRSIFVLALIVLVSVSTAAAETFELGGGEPVAVRVVESSASRVVLEYELGSFTATPVEIDGREYFTLALGEESNILEKGLPELPNVCRSIIIPDDAEMDVRVVSSSYTEFENLPVAPSKGNLTRDVEPATVPYVFDPVYAAAGPYPSRLAYARDPYIMRDFRGLVVVLNPFQYYPSTATLRVYDHVVVEAVAVGPGKTNVLTYRPETMNVEFRKIYERHFLNFEEAGHRYPWVDDGGNMLVICYDDAAFLAEMQPLVEWKNQMGVPCEMVTVTEAGGSAAAIALFIDQYYYEHGLAYVLLAGDAAQVPSTMLSDSSDPTYSLVTADTYPDLFVGRFSAENAAQLATQVLRTIEYEKRPQADGDWYHKGMGIGSSGGPGDDGEYDYEHEDYIRDDLLAFTYTAVDQIYDPGATSAQVTAGVNDGRSIINYTGHGSTTSWTTTGFSNTNVNALVNDNMLPHIVSVACYNGDFDSGTCFGEAWLRATNGAEPTGAIGFYGSTISQAWNPPMDAQDEIVDLLVGTSSYGVNRTFGGLCYNGCGHMQDEYGTDGYDEFIYWTIFGDPSLRVRSDTPAEIDVAHMSVIYPSMESFEVSVSTLARDPVEEAMCALYGNGVLYGVALTDAFGNAAIPMGAMPTPGEILTLTVTAFNTMTYTADLQVVAPVTYEIAPASIPINTMSDVTVTVWDNDGAPLPDVEITIDGWGITPEVDVTDTGGEAHFSLMPPYGESLTVVGSELSQTYNAFEDVLPVTGGQSFMTADVDASVESIGLYGMLAPYYEGVITGSASETGFELFALGCGVDDHANSGGATEVDLAVTPTSTGTIHAAIGKKGFNVYLEDVTVQVVYGQIAGQVFESEGGSPIQDAVVKGYPAGSDTTGAAPVFGDVTRADGAYTIEGDLEVGYYDVYVLKFGYLTAADEVFLQYGANDVDFYLDDAPSGVVSGYVTEVGTGRPLEATVKVYRADNMQMYAQVTSDSLLGGYYEVELPYFNYEMNVRAFHHIPETRGITVDEATESEDFVLEPTLANILLISDGVAKGGIDVRVDPKTGEVMSALPTVAGEAKSAAQMAADLRTIGYDVVEEAAASTNPSTWLSYDFIISASGDNTSPVADATYRSALESYVTSGGRLLIEGGEVGYDALSYPSYPSFASTVLHAVDWEHDSSGNLAVFDDTHPLTSFPNVITPITFTYVSYGDEDACMPAADASMPTDWTSYPGLSSTITYDDDADPSNGQIVYFEFDYLAAGAVGRVKLLENAVSYLTSQGSSPTGGISGAVHLEGETDHSGVLVTVEPGGGTAYTNASGHYEVGGLYAWTYTVTASKDGWSSDRVEGVEVGDGQQVGGVDMTLFPVVEYEHCETPALAIPDNVPAGVYDTLTFTEEMTVTDVEVYVNITHTYIGDLIVELTSPEGTTVRLHNRTGGTLENIVGWYDSELAVDGPGTLSDFIGEGSAGDWELWVSDNAGVDVGVLNEWCVHIWGGASTGVPGGDLGEAPREYVLRGASPNPFNPVTKVEYGMPSAGRVSLRVYNVAGKLVRVLVDGEEPSGYHEAVWDGRDDRGESVASGVYFARMEADGFHASTKMVLMK
jgi:subtilisin-like proprotein convertase family protein